MEGIWISHRAVSTACGFNHELIKRAEAQFGFILWSIVFNNCHGSSWSYEEPGFWADGALWKGSEQYFQFQKLKKHLQTENMRQKVSQMSDMESYEWGRALTSKQFCGPQEWERSRNDVMRKGIALKFSNLKLGALLNSTRGIPLVCIKSGYWGYPGSNMLGEILMECRGD